jgi:hypothetical protein
VRKDDGDNDEIRVLNRKHYAKQRQRHSLLIVACETAAVNPARNRTQHRGEEDGEEIYVGEVGVPLIVF